ncbi:MAG: hypothetical protein M3R66_18645, partial [Actinomycetota bacterium]|nr:hypothetical protein [Actinomycetota bacterium]
DDRARFRARDSPGCDRQLSGGQVVLEADLPAEAYEALVALDLSAFRQGPVHYDRQRGRWRSEPDEWQQRQG